MNCRQARLEIALWAGSDLDSAAERSVRRHLAECLGCRQYRERMLSAMGCLEQVDSGPDEAARVDSIWPSLSNVLSRRERDTRIRRFNGWVAGLAVAATLLATVTIWQNLPSAQPFYGEVFDANPAGWSISQDGAVSGPAPANESLSGQQGLYLVPVHQDGPAVEDRDVVRWPRFLEQLRVQFWRKHSRPPAGR